MLSNLFLNASILGDLKSNSKRPSSALIFPFILVFLAIITSGKNTSTILL